MILHALTDCYERLLAEGAVQPLGFQEKEISWLIELHPDGRLHALMATLDGKRGARFVVPMEVIRSRNIAANLLWDNPEYVLGMVREGADAKQAAKAPRRHEAFLKQLRSLARVVGDDTGLSAVLTFLEDYDHTVLIAEDPRWNTITRTNANISFKLAGDSELICNRAAVRNAIVAMAEADRRQQATAQCLVTGEPEPPNRLHGRIQGVRGAQATGANLVSFNLTAFESHGWTQGENAPVGPRAAHAYVAALNYLLRRDSGAHHHVEGNTTFVFWAGATTPLTEDVAVMLGTPRPSADEADGSALRDALARIRDGATPSVCDDPTPFYVLALAPNASRLAVRLWYEGSVGELLTRFSQHFEDLTIDRFQARVERPGLWRLLAAAAIGNEVSQLPDTLRGVLAAETMAAILKGEPYPAILLARVVERCRNERLVTSARAALIKAFLNRRARHHGQSGQQVLVSLDPSTSDRDYLLGRLVAVFERVQRTASPGIHPTPRNRLFGAAMTAPRSVFADLTRLRDIHLKSLRRADPISAEHFGGLISSILDAMASPPDVPVTLSLDAQARFILGYHHQRVVLQPAQATPAQATPERSAKSRHAVLQAPATDEA